MNNKLFSPHTLNTQGVKKVYHGAMLNKNGRVKSVLNFLFYLVVVVLSAFIASLAYPGKYNENGIAIVGFISLIPLFWIVYSSSYCTVWFYGLVYGFVFYYEYNYWLSTFHPLAILIAPILESVQYALLFLALRWTRTLFKKHYALFACLFYNAYLYITQLGFLGYPYGNITSAFYEYTSLIQIVSITGIWGLGLVLTLPQAFMADLIYSHFERKKLRPLVLSITLLIAVWLIGCGMKNYYDNKESEGTVKVLAVQHSADTWQGGYSTYKKNFETLKDLTTKGMEEDPDVDMVVWSETAFVPSVSWHQTYNISITTRKLVENFVEYGKNLGIPLVTGNPEGVIKDKDFSPVLDDGEWNWKTYNTVIYFSSGEIKGTYRKQHLVPFTEYFPYEKQFPHLYALLKANDYKWWEKGDEATVFEYNGVKFSTPICFEDTFGYLSAEFVKNGADMIINLSNDYWSRSVQAEKQHFQLAVFRAIENRRPLLRSTNSGITALVLPSGEIVNPLEPFTQSYGIYELPIGQKDGLTFYTRHPDLFGKLFVVLSIYSVLFKASTTIYEKVKRKKDEEERLAHMFERMILE